MLKAMLFRAKLIKPTIFSLLVLFVLACLTACADPRYGQTLTQDEIDTLIEEAIAGSTVLTESEISGRIPLTQERVDQIISYFGTENSFMTALDIEMNLTNPLIHVAVLDLLESEDSFARIQALISLFRLNDHPEERLTELLNYMINGNESERMWALSVFAYPRFNNFILDFGPYIDILVDAYNSADSEIRARFIRIFGTCKASPELLQLVLDATNADEQVIRLAVASTLSYWPDNDPNLINNSEITQALIKFVEDTDYDVRSQAIRNFPFDMDADIVVPVLIKIYKSDIDEFIRGQAFLALARLDAVPEIENEILGLLNSEDSDLVNYAIDAIPEVGAFPGLIERLCEIMTDDSQPEDRLRFVSRICGILRQLGPDACEAVPTLLQLLREEDGPAHIEIVHTLVILNDCSPDIVPAFGELLDVDPPHPGVIALGECGGDAAAAYILDFIDIISVTEITHETYDFEFSCAVNSLGMFPDYATTIVPHLLEHVETTDGTPLSINMRLALYRLGYEPKIQLRAILEILYRDVPTHSDEFYLLDRATWAVGEIGPSMVNALPRLYELEEIYGSSAGGYLLRRAVKFVEGENVRRNFYSGNPIFTNP